jgi:thiol-disulfide isomerase/thioredoxin
MLSCNLFCQEPKVFTLKGAINEKYNNDTIMLFAFANDKILSADTTVIKKGQFYFQGSAYTDEFSLLSIGNYPDSVISLEVILDEGDIEVSIEKDSKVGGSPLNIEYQTYIDSCPIYMKLARQEIEYQKREEKLRRFDSYKYSYKKRNSSNILGRRAYLHDFFDYLDKNFDDLYNNVFKDIKDDREVKKMMSDRQAYYDRYKTVGQKYTDVELETITGEKKKISDYVGKSKYLIIDFWASWCGPCIADMPYLKSLYDKYNNKGLEILGISFDEKRSAWDKSLLKLDAPWKHLRESKGIRSELGEAYNITSIPYALLIDQNGIIIAVNQRGLFLDNFLNIYLENKIS